MHAAKKLLYDSGGDLIAADLNTLAKPPMNTNRYRERHADTYCTMHIKQLDEAN